MSSPLDCETIDGRILQVGRYIHGRPTGWVVLGRPASPGALRPTVAHGVVCRGKVTVNSGAVEASLLARIAKGG